MKTDSARPWLLMVAVLGSGCASKLAAPAPQSSFPAQPAPPPSTSVIAPTPPTVVLTELDALEHDLEQSERYLLLQVERRQREVTTQAGSDEDWHPTNRPPAKPTTPSTGAADKARVTKPARAPEPAPMAAEQRGSACDLTCRALASMRRSAAGICEIAGTSSPRCQRAQERVRAAEDRLKGVACGCLTAP